ncbi:MAG TPA: alpha-E domain-containing protein [Miltoncostaeaceae bacterium]|nr:alpha-E domain-containing protein [Miltoncostaeaceae bacterium]
MLARVAESLYWTGRMIERADTCSRLLEVSHAMTRERAAAGPREVWEPLVEITGDLDRFLATHRRADERSVVWFLSFSPANPNSVMSCIRRARRNAHGVRELLPTDMWETLNGLHMELRGWPPSRITREGVYPFCRLVRRTSQLLQGIADQGMRHDAAWWFLRAGRYLERAEKTARLLEIRYRLVAPREPAVAAPADLHAWHRLLRSSGADEAFLRAGGGLVSPASIARFLLVDARFPRSVAYCLDEVGRGVEELIADGAMRGGSEMLGLLALTRDELLGNAAAARNGRLAWLLDHVQRRCNEIDVALAASCFAYPSTREGGAQRAQAARQAQN